MAGENRMANGSIKQNTSDTISAVEVFFISEKAASISEKLNKTIKASNVSTTSNELSRKKVLLKKSVNVNPLSAKNADKKLFLQISKMSSPSFIILKI